MRILLVDDDTVFSELLCTTLAEHGFENVVVAGSAKQALSKVETATVPFDCFLLDITMDEMDGIELCGALRRLKECRAVPIIMLTSSRASHHMKRAFDAGATDFLRKPLDTIEMVGRINSAMMLLEATKQDKRSRLALRAVIKYASDFNLIDLKERACFCEIEGMVDYYELENKVLKMRPGECSACLFSVRLRNFESFFCGKDRGIVLQLLHEMSTTISDSIKSYEAKFSYIGFGSFLIIQTKSLTGDATRIRHILTSSLTNTLNCLSHVGQQNSKIEVVSLSKKNVTSRDEILQKMHRRYIMAKQHDSIVLPDVKVIEDQLFEHIAKLEKEYNVH